jgi:hypothetical protein
MPGLPDDPRLSGAGTYAGRLQRLVWKLLLDHANRDPIEIPTNGRFVFYELEGLGLVVKPSQAEGERQGKRYGSGGQYSEQNVINALIELREQSIIPWDWIEDETRSLTEWQYADTVAEYVQDAVGRARINPWDGEPPLLLVESRSLGGVLRAMTYDYLVGIAATNGQTGGFLHTKVAPVLARNDRVVLYLGDEDLQGHQIEANTKAVLEKVARREIDWTRVAITPEQIEAEGLADKYALKKDKRYSPAREFRAWETEALGQGLVRQLVRDALDELLPEPLEDVRQREAKQRERVSEALEDLAYPRDTTEETIIAMRYEDEYPRAEIARRLSVSLYKVRKTIKEHDEEE